VLVWIDDQDKFEVIGIANGPARSLHRALRKAFIDCHGLPDNGLVYGENDHRAFCSLTRQAMIVQAM
jgi:hypothetical protein